MSLLCTSIHYSVSCKTTKPKRSPPEISEPDPHPVDWHNTILAEGSQKAVLSSGSLQEMTQQYLENIRITSNSLDAILSLVVQQNGVNDGGRNQATMRGLSRSKSMLNSIFDIATRLFPQDLEDTVDGLGNSHVNE